MNIIFMNIIFMNIISIIIIIIIIIINIICVLNVVFILILSLLKVNIYFLPYFQITTLIIRDAALTQWNLQFLLSPGTLRAVRFIKVRAKTDSTLRGSHEAAPVSIDVCSLLGTICNMKFR